MDSQTVVAAAHATFTGSIPFPQIVAQLIGEGVEYYHVDYLAKSIRFHDGAGTSVQVPIPFDDLPAVAPELDVSGLRANIRDSQQNHQPYRSFTDRAMRQGVQSYFAFLRGLRVTYLGRAGEHHVEWFPGAAPVAAATE